MTARITGRAGTEPSWLIRTSEITADATPFRFEADESERRALGGRFELISLDRFVAEGTVARRPGTARVRLEARLTASLVQSCVVTLEPVATSIEVAFARDYDTAADTSVSDEREEIHTLTDEEPIVEAIRDDVIDVGAAAAEELGLELDPFPRAAGAVFGGFATGGGEHTDAPARANPFAVLSALRGERKTDG